ncbi:MAG: hypothetical protein WDM86_07945 [Rhizomicrobium sp.]
MRIGLAVAVLLCLCTGAFAEPAWHTYTDARRGFSISYPDGWTVDPDFRDLGYGFHQGDADDYRDGVALKPAGDLAPGTNLESDQLVLAIEMARPADRCVARAFLVDPSPDVPTDMPVDKPDAVRTIAQPGDRYIVEHFVIVLSHTPCVAVHYFVNSARLRPGDGKKPFDEGALVAYLNRIAETLKSVK